MTTRHFRQYFMLASIAIVTVFAMGQLMVSPAYADYEDLNETCQGKMDSCVEYSDGCDCGSSCGGYWGFCFFAAYEDAGCNLSCDDVPGGGGHGGIPT
ncbi:MAG: hypothetical protein PVJ49_02685 [Acidobacteriota bacterium]